jgi:hypothetical protein
MSSSKLENFVAPGNTKLNNFYANTPSNKNNTSKLRIKIPGSISNTPGTNNSPLSMSNLKPNLTRGKASRSLVGRNIPGNNKGVNTIKRRSNLYKGKNVKPSPYIMINPDQNMPFSSNLWLNNAHKVSGRISGVTPENIVERYTTEHAAIQEEIQAKESQLQDLRSLQQRKENALRQAQEELKIAKTAKRNFKVDAGIQKKPFWKFWGGKRRKTRKSRKSRK